MGRYTSDVINALLRAGQRVYFLSSRNLEFTLREKFNAGFWEFIHYKKSTDISFLDTVWHPWNRIDFLGAGRNVVNIHDTMPFSEFADHLPKSHRERDQQRLLHAAARADDIVTLSEFARDEIIKNLYINKSAINVISPGISPVFSKKTYSASHRKKLLEKYAGGSRFILYVGSSDKRKNWLGLLKAFAVLKNKYHIKQKLVIVGNKVINPGIFSKNKEKKEIAALLNRYIDAGELYRIDEINDAELLILYNLADAFIFPSFYEGFGLPILEAQKCGAAVLTSDAASMPEAGGGGVIKFNPHDSLDIAEKVYSILHDNGLRGKLIKKGFENAGKHSYEKCAQELLKVFER